MFSPHHIGRITQHAVCLLIAMLIVIAAIAVAEYRTQTTLRDGYSITITQLQ